MEPRNKSKTAGITMERCSPIRQIWEEGSGLGRLKKRLLPLTEVGRAGKTSFREKPVVRLLRCLLDIQMEGQKAAL